MWDSPKLVLCSAASPADCGAVLPWYGSAPVWFCSRGGARVCPEHYLGFWDRINKAEGKSFITPPTHCLCYTSSALGWVFCCWLRAAVNSSHSSWGSSIAPAYLCHVMVPGTCCHQGLDNALCASQPDLYLLCPVLRESHLINAMVWSFRELFFSTGNWCRIYFLF